MAAQTAPPAAALLQYAWTGQSESNVQVAPIAFVVVQTDLVQVV